MDERLYGALGVKPLILLSTIRHEFYAPHSIIASGLKYSLSLMISFTNPGKSLIKPKIFILQGIFAIKVLHYNIAFNYCVYQKGCLGRNPLIPTCLTCSSYTRRKNDHLSRMNLLWVRRLNSGSYTSIILWLAKHWPTKFTSNKGQWNNVF